MTATIKLVLLAALAALALAASGCAAGGTPAARFVVDGDRDRAPELFRAYGCHACHTIPGVRRATGLVGPPLNEWGDRHYIAGRAQNNPDNLIRFLLNPESISPGTAMPITGVTDQDARDMAAYLYGLRRAR